MTTHPFVARDFQSEVLAIVVAAGSGRAVSEGKLLEALFPPPPFPKDGSEGDKVAWREAWALWRDGAYGSETIAYVDSFCATVSGACCALVKRGALREHNNGYASYSYSLPGGRK